MKYSKLISIILIVCVAITFLGVASAAEEVVNGVKFNIPDGFVKNEEMSSVSKSTYGTDEIAFYENGDDCISLTISSLNSGIAGLPQGDKYEDKNISGINGKYSSDEDGEEFSYAIDNKSITIWLPHNCTVTFEDIIINAS